MPPTTSGSRRKAAPALRGSAVRRPSELNERSFADRFASDIGSMLTNLPRALGTMAGAVGSDTVMRAGRALVPGGSTGFDYGVQSWDHLVKPVGESLLDTGKLVSQVTNPLSYATEGGREDLGERWEEFQEHPGIFAVEHIGNAAIGGALAGQGLKAGARAAAGQSAKGLGRAGKASQLAEIEAAGGAGSRLAQAGRISGDLVGHPYRAAGRRVGNTNLPSPTSLFRGEGIRRNASLNEVIGQVRESAPLDRNTWTPEQRDAASLRSMRGEVEGIGQRLAEAEAAGEVSAVERLRAEQAEATSRLSSFEQDNAARMGELEEARLTPLPVADLSSPLARGIRSNLDTERVQRLTAPVTRARRETRGLVEDLKRERTEATFDTLTTRNPDSRRSLAVRQIRDLDKALDGQLKELGLTVPGRTGRITDDALFETLDGIRANPELRASLPRVDAQIELTMLDLYERRAGLPDGSLRNQLYDDATLTPEIADTVRGVQRGSALPDDLPPEVRSAVDDALGQAYRVPEEQLANPVSAHPEIADVYNDALTQITREAGERDAILANEGLGDPQRWAMRAEQVDGEYRPTAPDQAPDLLASPSSKQAKGLRKLGLQVRGARQRLEKLQERVESANAGGRENAYDNYRGALREQKRAAVALDRARKAGDEDLATQLRGQLDDARTRAQASRAEARKTINGETRAAVAAIEGVVRAMARTNNPVGGLADLGADLNRMLGDLESLFAEADLGIPPRLEKALSELSDAGVDLGAVDAHTLDNLLRLGSEADGDVTLFRDAASGAKKAASRSRDVRGRATTQERLIRAEERAGQEMKNLNAIARRLEATEGRLANVDQVELNAAIDRATAARDAADSIAREAGVELTGKRTPSRERGAQDRLLREQVKARLRAQELRRAAKSMERIESKFDAAEAEMLRSIDAAPAVARPVLQATRALQGVDDALRAADLDHVADDLNLTGLPQTLEEMAAAGVSPTFLRRLEDRLGAEGYRAASEQPVKTPTMSAQKRRTMGDVDLQRDLDRVKIETDVELAGRVISGQMIEQFNAKFGRSADQIGEALIEQGKATRDQWRDMPKPDKERLLQENGFNTYNPDEIFSFKVRRTSDDATWIPTLLNDSLKEYLKKGPIETFLTEVLGPATTAWKHFVLALRPAWHVYNIVGNAAMSMLAGQVAPKAYLEFMKPGSEAHQMLRAHRLGWDLEQGFGLTPELATELLDSGLSRDLVPDQKLRARLSDALVNQESVRRFLDSRAGRTGGRARKGFQTVTGASYRANAFMDNLNRTSIYLYDTIKQGMDPSDAVRHANRVLGEYTSMSHAERVYLRSAFPFYAWMRHITRLSSDMLRPENINRAAMLGTVAQTLGEPEGIEAMFPEYMAGDMLLPGTDIAIGMRGFNPFQDVLDTVMYNGEISTRGLSRSLHPLAQFGLERNSGIDTLTGRPFSRPVPVLDDLGREIPTAPSLGRHALDKFGPPQLGLLESLGRAATGRTNIRYGSGDPVLIEGAREPNMAAGIGSFLGAPLRFPDVEGVEERRAEASDRVSRQIERYAEEMEAYEQERRDRTLGEKLVPFGR